MATGEIVQQEFKGMDEWKKRPTSMTEIDLLQIALSNNAAIDVIERIAALAEKAKMQQAEIEFNEALNKVQTDIERIAPDKTGDNGKRKWASYAAMDKVVRPIYTKYGFSLSFSDEPLPTEREMLRLVGYLSRGLHTRKYYKEMPTDGKGAKGGDVLTKADAQEAADSRAKRYMLKDIFNIAIGEEENYLDNGWLVDEVKAIENAQSLQGLKDTYFAAFNQAKEDKNGNAMLILTQAYERRKANL